jgi:hypothetical protein
MYAVLEQIALAEFGDMVTGVRHIGRRANVTLKLRLLIRDGSFVDIWFDPSATRYAFHWEQRAQRGRIDRHDNAPDHPHIPTHPKHFHHGTEETVEASYIPDSPAEALRYFLDFVRHRLVVQIL